MDPIYLDGPSEPYDQIEIDEEDEEDQLDSDLENDSLPHEKSSVHREASAEAPPPPTNDGEQLEPDPDDEVEDGASTAAGPVSGKRKAKKSGVRIPGQTLIPQVRLENILRADGETGPMSKEAIYVLSIATEEFIQRLIRAGHANASASKRNVINYRDMSSAVPHHGLSFLEDTIPTPIPLQVALDRQAHKEKELLEEDPALHAATTNSNHTLTLAQMTHASASTDQSHRRKSSSKPRAGQGDPEARERAEREKKAANAHAREQRQRDRAEAAASRRAPVPTGAATGRSSSSTSERPRSTRQRDSRGRYSTSSASGGNTRRRSEPRQGSAREDSVGSPAANGMGEDSRSLSVDQDGHSSSAPPGADVFGAMGRTIYSAR